MALPNRLRVLTIITRGERGGAQVHVLDLVRGLRDAVDFEVVVGEEEFLPRELRAAGVPVTVMPELEREVSARNDVRAVRALRRKIRSMRPNLVHTHSTKAGLLGRLAAFAEGVPAVHTAHAWSFSDGLPLRRVASAVPIEALAGRITSRFIVVSEADREIALRYRVARAAQVRVIHNALPDHPGAAHPEADPPTVVMVARLAAPKDPLLLLQALAAIDAPWRLRLVGDGPERPQVEAEIARLGLGGRVTMEGVRADVPDLLAASQVFTLVSRQEGFPISILEAMRAGLPVIASDVGGIRESVRDGVTGRLVPRGDRPALTAALAEALTRPERRRAWGAAGRATYLQRFTVADMLDRTRHVYEELR